MITGEFNDVKLAKITPDPKTGEFTLNKLVFKEGGNTLKLSGQSNLGKVEPLNVTLLYGQQKANDKTNKADLYKSLLIVLFAALAFAGLLGYLIYKKKLRIKLGAGNTANPPQQPPTEIKL